MSNVYRLHLKNKNDDQPVDEPEAVDVVAQAEQQENSVEVSKKQNLVILVFRGLFWCLRWPVFMSLLWLRILIVPILNVGSFLLLITALGLYFMNPSTAPTCWKLGVVSFVCFIVAFSYDALLERLNPYTLPSGVQDVRDSQDRP